MKKKFLKIITMLCFICCFGMTSYAYESLHICERFDVADFEAYEYWKRTPHWYATPEHYVRVENDELVLSLGAYTKSEGEGSSESWPILTLPTPVSTGKVTISFDLKLNEAGNLISYHGIGSMYSSSSVMSKGICSKSNALNHKPYCNAVDPVTNTTIVSKEIPRSYLMDGYNTIKIKVDLDNKLYDIYVGDDSVPQIEDMPYLGEDLYKIGFNIAPSRDCDYKVYIDNVEVYDETKYIFVSNTDGNDENPATIEEPVKSISRAVEMYSEYDDARIYLLSGEYDLPEGYTYNYGDIVNAMNDIIIYPYYRQEVYFNNVSLDLPELENIAAPQEFKDKAMNAINRYSYYFPYKKFLYDNFYINYDYENNYIKYGFEIKEGGSVADDVRVIAAIYSCGKLIDVITEDVNVKSGVESKLDFEFNTNLKSDIVCKIFIWDIKTLRPIGKDVLSSYVPGFITIYSEDIIPEENTMRISGKSLCDAYIMVKLVDEEGKNVAINQYEVIEGDFEIKIKSRYSLQGTRLYIQEVAKQ